MAVHPIIVYGAAGKSLKAVKSFHVNSMTCVRIGMDGSEWFPVHIRLRQSCAVSPWMFNACYMNGVVQR